MRENSRWASDRTVWFQSGGDRFRLNSTKTQSNDLGVDLKRCGRAVLTSKTSERRVIVSSQSA